METRKLQFAFLAMFEKKVVINYDNGKVSLTPVIEDALAYLKTFIMGMNENKTVFIVDSYQPSLNFESVFGKVTHVLWGEKGDPLNTNSKQLIVCDTYHFGVNDFMKGGRLQLRVRMMIEEALKLFPPEKLMIVTTNKKMASVIYSWSEHEWGNNDRLRITWFRSELMRGVQAEDRRILIFVGGPYLPQIAYAAPSKSFKLADFAIDVDASSSDEEKAGRLPSLLKLDDMRSEFTNAIGRVKDPNGQEKSIVLTLGMLIEEVRALLRDSFQFEISKPNVTKTPYQGAMVNEGLLIVKLWMDGFEVETKHLPILARIINCAGQKKSISASQVMIGQTELVKSIALKYQSILEKYGVEVTFKQGGMSFAKA